MNYKLIISINRYMMYRCWKVLGLSNFPKSDQMIKHIWSKWLFLWENSQHLIICRYKNQHSIHCTCFFRCTTDQVKGTKGLSSIVWKALGMRMIFQITEIKDYLQEKYSRMNYPKHFNNSNDFNSLNSIWNANYSSENYTKYLPYILSPWRKDHLE